MKNITIYSKNEPISREYFARMYEILKYSFPQTERRSFNAHFSEFEKPEFRSMVLEDGDILGFMNFWEFPGSVYLEHFAVAAEMRGRGLGASLMDELKKVSEDRPVILEAEQPEISDIAARRIRFYERLGFIVNPYKYRQPPYNDGDPILTLVIMSYPSVLSREDFPRIRNELYKTVYELPEGADLYSAEI